jgi:long-chain acyl-CoA synthetase
MLTLANLAANYDRTPGWLGLTEATVTLCALPLYNTFGLNQCINALMVTGGAMVLLPKFEPNLCLESIERFGCTFLPAVPTMLRKILDHPERPQHDLSSISTVMTGGAAVPAALLRDLSTAVAPEAAIFVGYGLTEATALVTLARVPRGDDAQTFRPQSIGKVLDGIEMRIATEDGGEAASGIVGEISLRGPSVMLGYYARPDETAIALSNGWLRTGDLGFVQDDGVCHIVDRKKDIIIRGGQNLYPAEIEEVLYRVEGIREAAVIGRPDEIMGEVPVAFVATAPEAGLTAEMLIARCKAELAGFKAPAAVHFLPELPKGPTGKILRRELRQGCASASITPRDQACR